MALNLPNLLLRELSSQLSLCVDTFRRECEIREPLQA